MQSYEEFEKQQAKEVMAHDLAFSRFHGISLEELMKQTTPEPLIDKAYRLHKEQRQANMKVNLAFNRLAFSVKQQISENRKGERHGNVV